jgi:hypothetical protein
MMSREQLIKSCIELTMALHGLKPQEISRAEFFNMSDEELVQEYNWLWDMVNLK